VTSGLFLCIVRGDPVTLLRGHLEALSEAEEASYFKLSHHASVNKGPKEIDTIQDSVILSIFQTNAIGAGPGKVGIYPRTARLNHGCVGAFNSVYSWREEEGVLGTF
jgi:hypothetical protein